MTSHRFAAGLTVPVPSPIANSLPPAQVITQESGITAPTGLSLRIVPLVKEGDIVACGAAVARLRDAPSVQFVAPMAARVGRITLATGARLSEIVLFCEDGADQCQHDVSGTDDPSNLRAVMQKAGVWPWLRRRPFGGMPAPDERPEAIVVMAVDTRPLTPDPHVALAGRMDALTRGVRALARLTDGPVLRAQPAGQHSGRQCL